MGEGVYTVVTNEVRMYVRYKTAQAKHENSFFCMMLTVAIYWSPLLRCTIGVCTYVFLTIQNQIEVQYMFLFMSYIITLCITLFYHITSYRIIWYDWFGVVEKDRKWKCLFHFIWIWSEEKMISILFYRMFYFILFCFSKFLGIFDSQWCHRIPLWGKSHDGKYLL